MTRFLTVHSRFPRERKKGRAKEKSPSARVVVITDSALLVLSLAMSCRTRRPLRLLGHAHPPHRLLGRALLLLAVIAVHLSAVDARAAAAGATVSEELSDGVADMRLEGNEASNDFFSRLKALAAAKLTPEVQKRVDLLLEEAQARSNAKAKAERRRARRGSTTSTTSTPTAAVSTSTSTSTTETAHVSDNWALVPYSATTTTTADQPHDDELDLDDDDDDDEEDEVDASLDLGVVSEMTIRELRGAAALFVFGLVSLLFIGVSVMVTLALKYMLVLAARLICGSCPKRETDTRCCRTETNTTTPASPARAPTRRTPPPVPPRPAALRLRAALAREAELVEMRRHDADNDGLDEDLDEDGDVIIDVTGDSDEERATSSVSEQTLVPREAM